MNVQTDIRLEYSSVSSFIKYKRFETQVGNIKFKNSCFYMCLWFLPTSYIACLRREKTSFIQLKIIETK